MRLQAVICGYLAAAFVGAFILIGAESPSVLLSFEAAAGGAFLLVGIASFAMLLSAPIAIPALVIAEIKHINSPWYFTAAGLVLGTAMLGLLGQNPMDAISDRSTLTVVLLFLAATTGAALSYWLVAWKLFRPHGNSTKYPEK